MNSYYFERNKERGNKAEDIVIDLFREAGFRVIRYGYEHTLPQLCNRGEIIQGASADYIRHMPDLVVINNNNQAFFVEVKYRTDETLKDKDLFNYPCCYVVLVSPNGILAQEVQKIKGTSMSNFIPLNQLSPFEYIPNELIVKFDEKVRRRLGNETWWGQFWKYHIKKKTPPKKSGKFEGNNQETPCAKCGKLKPAQYKHCFDCFVTHPV